MTSNNIFEELKSNPDRIYLIAEIGINHNGDLDIAKKLIDASYACGWDCVKFQKRNPDVCVPEEQKNTKRSTPWGEMTYLEYKHRVEFEADEYNEINRYCKDKPIPWTVSIWDLDSLKFILDYNVPYIKIPSAHITNLKLIEEAAKTKIPILISTGMSDWRMVDEAVEILEKEASSYAILHCNSTYPAPYDELNLDVILEMKNRYDCLIGYSGHEYGLLPSQIAATIGARIIERHVTLDHEMWGTDQSSSIEVLGMELLKKRVKDIVLIRGERDKIITESEKLKAKKLRL